MDTYSILRQFADSWALLALFGFFVGAAIWAFIPSQRQAREDASRIPFRNDTCNSARNGDADRCANNQEPSDG